jgi:hypothetical protein
MGASGMVWCGLDERPYFALRQEWMRHREIEFSVEHASKRDDVWVWRFSIGGEVRTGKTVAKLKLLAIRRVQFIIDRELRKRNVPSQHDTGSDNARE